MFQKFKVLIDPDADIPVIPEELDLQLNIKETDPIQIMATCGSRLSIYNHINTKNNTENIAQKITFSRCVLQNNSDYII